MNIFATGFWLEIEALVKGFYRKWKEGMFISTSFTFYVLNFLLCIELYLCSLCLGTMSLILSFGFWILLIKDSQSLNLRYSRVDCSSPDGFSPYDSSDAIILKAFLIFSSLCVWARVIFCVPDKVTWNKWHNIDFWDFQDDTDLSKHLIASSMMNDCQWCCGIST